MEKQILDQTHPCYDGERWKELSAIAKGGKKFHSLIDRFLPRNPMEPEPRYDLRKKSAKYRSYTGTIINLYVAWLFAAGFEAKPHTRDSSDPVTTVAPFYGKFQENIGAEQTLKAFMKDRFRDAMTTGHAIWVAQLPQMPEGVALTDYASWEQAGLGNVTLSSYNAEDLLDWEEDDYGELQWCILKTVFSDRGGLEGKRNTITEQWRYYDATEVAVYELTYEKHKPPGKTDKAKLIGRGFHGFKRVPVMRVCLPEEMCVGELTYDSQLQHFQLDAALNWAMKASCYPTPVFKLASDDNKPTLGIGYALFLSLDEELEYASPPSDAFEIIGRNRDHTRDELFRIVHQMAQGMDNNAETVGRSADSKEIDAAATRIMLHAYGELIGKAIEETYELISEMRGDEEYEWSVEGFSGYDTATASSLLGNIEKAREIGIPSMTFQREISKKAALALTPELDPRQREAIRQEIDAFEFTLSGDLVEERVQADRSDTQKTVTKQTLRNQKAISKQTIQSAEKVAAMKPKPAPAF